MLNHFQEISKQTNETFDVAKQKVVKIKNGEFLDYCLANLS